MKEAVFIFAVNPAFFPSGAGEGHIGKLFVHKAITFDQRSVVDFLILSARWHHPGGQQQGYQDKAFHSAKVNTTAPARVGKQGLPLASG